MDCKLCEFHNDNLKRFSDHLRSVHNLSSEQYTIETDYSGTRPTCPVCGQPVRYVSFSFKKYCKDHARLAMVEGGKIGGQAEAWNKGETKETDPRIAAIASLMTGSANPFYGRKHTQETLRKISENKMLGTMSIEQRISERSSEFTLVTSLDEYRSRQRQYLVFRCNECGEEQPKTLQAFERGSRCYKCHPLGKSNWELDVHQFVKGISPDALSGDRTVLAPREIDVYVPSAKLGIECHGLYWHSEASHPEGFDKRRHGDKFKTASEKGIRLLQIFEDEWRDKRSIVSGMIRHRLGKNLERCKTWSTKVVELETPEERIFFDATHIAGYTPSRMSWGLKDRSGIIVAALSLRVPRNAKRYGSAIEVARFASLPGMTIPGGLSKLMSAATTWSKTSGHDRIMTYVDQRIGSGKGYQAVGFQEVSKTDIDYWYTDGVMRYDRFKFRACEGKSERQVASEARMSRIYGCGASILSFVF